jgi:hypothetical protein
MKELAGRLGERTAWVEAQLERLRLELLERLGSESDGGSE